MKIKFSQKWAKEKYEMLVRSCVKFVKGSRSAPDLLVKIFFYKQPKSSQQRFRGNYRNEAIHGFYDSESKYLTGGIRSIITLKLSERQALSSDLDIWEIGDVIPDIKFYHNQAYRNLSESELAKDFISIFAHEFKHYLDMRDLVDRSKYRHWEVRANKFSAKMADKWNKVEG